MQPSMAVKFSSGKFHEKNGLLVDFFSASELIAAITSVCKSKDRLRDLRDAARKTIIDRYDFETICLPAQVRVIEGEPASSD